MNNPAAAPVTVDSALFTFYDIESLSNVFSLCAYTPYSNGADSSAGSGANRPSELKVFYLVDDPDLLAGIDAEQLVATIKMRNPALAKLDNPATPLVTTLWDLREERANIELAMLMGLSTAESVNDPASASQYPAHFRPVCDTDPGYDPAVHPYLAGYNSFSYDTVMLAMYLAETFPAPHRGGTGFMPSTARELREHNMALFSDEFRSYMPNYLVDLKVTKGLGWRSQQKRIHTAMIQSGRHLDVARLNELQVKVGLKRLLGMLGHQILESDKLGHDATINTVEELYELLAYNVADCVGLSHLLKHPTYAGAFELKKGLLDEYFETIYKSERRAGDNVRRDRLTVDSSSAKFVGRILCPNGHLDDIEAVSFLYPSKTVAEQEGIKQVDVLDECRSFFENEVAAPGTPAHTAFMEVFNYYDAIRGQNFNDSEEYRDKYGRPARSLADIAKTPNNLPYFDAAGQPTSCFATFSTGGIHGAEANMRHFAAELQSWRDEEERNKRLELHYPDPLEVRLLKEVVLPLDSAESGQATIKYNEVLTSKSTIKALRARSEALSRLGLLLGSERLYPDQVDAQREAVLEEFAGIGYKPKKKQPTLFEKKGDGSTKLHPKYTFTSADAVIHEDFTSYYPNLLRNLSAFYNPELGEDRYAKIFFDKERLGAEMKAPGLSAAEKARLSTLRNGTKLILNTASGAGDASHKTPIRMNNMIISMRLIGQLFSWRIGQAQTLAGARIISTNTDGLYSVLDEETNNRVLEEQKAAIGIDIEPEPMFLISKDSNNRLELSAPKPGASLTDSRIVAAGGGTLACHAGPRPDKSLAHPAVLDHTLAQYLQTIVSRGGQAALDEAFDHELGAELIEAALMKNEPVKAALLFQNVLAASRGSITYPFAADPMDPNGAGESEPITNARSLQMINRVFVVKAGTPGAVSLRAAGAWKVPAASLRKRETQDKSNVAAQDETALAILEAHGWAWPDAYRAASAAGGADWTNDRALIPADREVCVRKITGIDPTWSMLICNEDLHVMDELSLLRILCALDLDVYRQWLAETYDKNWRNA